MELIDVARDSFVYVDLAGLEWDRRPDFVLRNAPNPNRLFGMVLQQRLDDVDAALASARGWFAERGREEYVWLVADSARPNDLVERLTAAGATPDTLDPVYAGMILEHAPESVDGIEVRKATSFEDYSAGVQLAWRSFGFSAEQQDALHAKLHERYEIARASPIEMYLAAVDGEVVGSGSAATLPCGLLLLGGNVAEEARGRGVYRALVRARWDDAVARSTPGLVVQAGQLSKPILERLGFEQVCEVHAMIDRT